MKKSDFAVTLIFLFCFSLCFSGTVKIWFAGTTGDLITLVENSMIPEFEKNNPGINVQAEFIPWGDLSTKLTTSFAGNIGPDIFMHGQAAIAGFAVKELILPLDAIIPQLEDASDFGGTFDVGLFKGKKYMVPVYGSGRLLAYRKDFFESAGIDPSEAPVTWEQLRAYAKKLTVTERGAIQRAGVALPVSGIDLQQVWTAFLIQNGGELFDNEFNPRFNGQEGIEALQFYVQMIRNDKVSPDTGVPNVGNVDAIVSGGEAMVYITMENLSDIRKYFPEEYNAITITMPVARVKRATFYSFAGFMVSAKTKNLAETTKVLAYFTSKRATVEINKALGGLPPRQSAADEDFIKNDPVMTVFLQGSKYAFGNPNVPFWVQARDILSKYLERAVKGVLSPKEALDSAAVEISKLK
jgi:multiple sugar transport system substrate-binding protein